MCLHGVPPAPADSPFQRCGGGACRGRSEDFHASIRVLRCWHATTCAAGFLVTVRDPTCDPDTSSDTALTPPGLGLWLGAPADVSRAGAAAPSPSLSYDGATPYSLAAATTGRPDTGWVPSLWGPRTAWPAELPRGLSVGFPSCSHAAHATPPGDRYLSESTRAAQQLELGSASRSGAPCDADSAAQTGG